MSWAPKMALQGPRDRVFPGIFPSIRDEGLARWPPRVGRLIARHVSRGGCAQLDAGHRLEDLGSDRKALLPPALRLGAVQHIVREKAETGRGGDLARQLAGECQIFGDDVEGAAGGKSTGQYRARDVVKGPAG